MPQPNAKKTLARNMLFLYALTFSSQLINLATIPYQTRVLPPELFGVVGFVIALMNVLSLVLNLGFLYSATQRAAEHRDEPDYISRLYTSVYISKAVIGLFLFVMLQISILLIPFLNEHALLINLYYVAYFTSTLLPDYLYRGLERMGTITGRTVSVRLAAAAMIFIFLKDESDILVLPLSMLIGNLAAFGFCVVYDRRVLGIRLSRVAASEVVKTTTESLPFFVSRAASTVYQSGNALILGALYPGQAVVGWFNASDKILSAVKQVSSPVADAIYPYMVRRKDYRLAIKLMIIAAPFIVACAVLLFIFAEPFCVLVFGQEYAAAADVIRCLIPAMAVILPTYLVCFPILVPMGLSRFANASNVVGMVIQLALLGILFATNSLNVYSISLSASFSEVSVFLFRLGVMIKYRDRMKTSAS